MIPYDVLSVKPILFLTFSHVYYFETETTWGKNTNDIKEINYIKKKLMLADNAAFIELVETNPSRSKI